MAEDKFKHIVTSIIVIALFAFLVMGFAIFGAPEYDVELSNEELSDINFTGINKTLTDAKGHAEIWEDVFTADKFVSIGTGILIITGLVNLMIGMVGIMTIPFKMFIQIFTNVLGFPAIIPGVIIFVFIVTIIFGLWRLYKQGE